ncbi:hypothetical protein SASPL_130822 [Salvia splendens]|uniref:Uncharacterized protein n=1 Tax=Salvia splendens TaxID=180675 RepID=A0A8X8X8X8_SALSN|nr:uncharacterized protein LOC121755144 [Salvia splendens]KAG6407823.1 hypothetical protein SASPL_130822 [Salvia splendens]
MDCDRMQEPFQEEEDDVFYCELRRQVLQLTAEDDDGDVCEAKAMKVRKQGPYVGALQPVCYQGWPGIKEGCGSAAPAWIVNLWRSGNGTGVFIPQGVQSRRTNRSRRKNGRGKGHKRVERMN